MPKAISKKKPVVQKDMFVSVILLADKHTSDMVTHIPAVSEQLRARYSNYEIIIIDNFMETAELTAVADLLPSLPCIRVVRLSKMATQDTAVFTGLEAAIGDVVVMAMPNRDPLELIPTFVRRIAKADIVFGMSDRRLRKGLLNRYGAELFYWYNKKYLRIAIPANSTYFMAFNRRAVNALTRSGRHARHIRYLARQVGYRMDEFVYQPLSDRPEDKKSLKELMVSALELTTNYSQHPLRMVVWLGTVAALANLLYCIYVVTVRILKSHVAEGWASLSLQSAMMFFFVFLILAVLSEYVAKILEESRDEPPYHVMDELVSTISVADVTRTNITR